MEHREDHNEIPEFTLEDILAEFGSGSDLYRTEDLPAEENSPETAPAEAPAQQEAPAEPEPHAEPETSAVAELPGKPEGLRFTPGADPVDMDFPAEVLEEVFSSGGPLLPEEDQPPETQIIHFPHQPVSEEEGKPAAETTATEASSEENAPEEEPAEEPQETPEPQEAPKVSLEQIMNDTVSSVLEEQEDGILEERPPLREVLRHWWEKLTRPRSAAPIPQDTETLWEQPQEPQPEPEPDPEPDMDVAVRAEKRRCARLKRQCWCVLPEAVLLTVLSVLDGLGLYIPRLWAALPVLRGIIPGGSLLLALALSGRVWRSARKQLSQRRITCEAAALLASLVCLGDCVYAALGYGEQLPLAAVPVISLLLCLWGQLLAAKARLAGFRLADLGGEPPYNVSVTPAGACKQQGTAEGFYRLSHQPDVSYRWQIILTPLALAAASILAAVVCFGGEGQPVRPLWIWSALLSGGLPLALPVAGTLPLSSLNRRLNRSGSAVAGYAGASAITAARRMVVTDDDLFPPGTVSLNGLKLYGEEIGKVVSYAATAAQAAGSQLTPLFDQLLASEGGTHLHLEDLRFYEDGGIGGTIRGESVTMGSAYFMKKHHVSLPRDLKLKTGVFLAVDGQLIAIFAIKYQPSRNVEWALRAMRRNRITPVLATRSANITPALLKRKFRLDARPLYPDISTRLALSELTEGRGRPHAIIYRDGLMAFAETVIGSRRMRRAVRDGTVLSWLGGLSGLLLAYYFTSVGVFAALSALNFLCFLLLWLLTVLLLAGLVRHY